MRNTLGMLCALGCLWGAGFARGNDAASLKAELADLKAKVRAMEAARMAPAAGGDAESLTSLKKKGSIEIGGEVALDLMVLHREDGDANDDGDPRDRPGDGDDVDSTSFYTNEAYLSFAVKASENVSLNILLDLDDTWDENGDQDDLLEECYFLWEAVGGTGWSLAFGKKGVDYGMDDAIGITTSMHEGCADFLADWEEPGANGSRNAHNAVGTNDLPAAQPSDLFVVEAEYRYKELARFYAALFQNNETTGGGAVTRGMHEDRSDDTLFFQSFAARAELYPVEGLELQASVIRWHLDSQGDGDLRLAAGEVTDRDDASADKTALSLGFRYALRSVPLSVFGQYQHGWDWTYHEDVDADVANVGGIWQATEALGFGLMGEWAEIDDVPGYEEETYWQVAANATYAFDNGITLTLEYAHAWYDADMTGVADDDVDRDADMVGFRVGWEF